MKKAKRFEGKKFEQPLVEIAYAVYDIRDGKIVHIAMTNILKGDRVSQDKFKANALDLGHTLTKIDRSNLSALAVRKEDLDAGKQVEVDLQRKMIIVKD